LAFGSLTAFSYVWFAICTKIRNYCARTPVFAAAQRGCGVKHKNKRENPSRYSKYNNKRIYG